MSQALSVVIPAYNEQGSIAGVITEVRERLIESGLAPEILVVDDGSTDDTSTAAFAAGARVIRHRSNRGYGAALKTGILAARHDIIAIIDADGTYPATVIPAMVEKLRHADMVVGARVGEQVHIPWIRRPAKWLLNRLANYVACARIPDLNSGLRLFRRDVVLQYFPILPDQFSWTSTVTLALLSDQYAVDYLPIDYRPRQGRSKIVPWDAASFAVLILRTAMLFRPLRVFLPLALVCAGYGVVKTLIDLREIGNLSASATLGLLSGLLILLIGMLGDAMATRLGRLSVNPVIGVRAESVEMAAEKEAGDSALPRGGG
jgi:glycosyltransferase involved in cell wall biosynthesis